MEYRDINDYAKKEEEKVSKSVKALFDNYDVKQFVEVLNDNYKKGFEIKMDDVHPIHGLVVKNVISERTFEIPCGMFDGWNCTEGTYICDFDAKESAKAQFDLMASYKIIYSGLRKKIVDFDESKERFKLKCNMIRLLADPYNAIKNADNSEMANKIFDVVNSTSQREFEVVKNFLLDLASSLNNCSIEQYKERKREINNIQKDIENMDRSWTKCLSKERKIVKCISKKQENEEREENVK